MFYSEKLLSLYLWVYLADRRLRKEYLQDEGVVDVDWLHGQRKSSRRHLAVRFHYHKGKQELPDYSAVNGQSWMLADPVITELAIIKVNHIIPPPPHPSRRSILHPEGGKFLVGFFSLLANLFPFPPFS